MSRKKDQHIFVVKKLLQRSKVLCIVTEGTKIFHVDLFQQIIIIAFSVCSAETVQQIVDVAAGDTCFGGKIGNIVNMGTIRSCQKLGTE